MVREPQFDLMSKVALIWKLGSNSDKDILSLTALTGPVDRWLNAGLDFTIMPATVVWFAPRYANRVGDGYELTAFSELDPQDEGWVNVSIQQVTSVTPFIPNDLRQMYLNAIPERFKSGKIF